jgi:hypothetical protein
MAIEITTEIIINAAPEKVWIALLDFEKHPAWNPFITSILGEALVGERLEVCIAPPGGQPMTFKPKVLAVTCNAELRWLGHLLFPGLFDGEHRFLLTANPNGSTTLVQSERFTGVLVPLFRKSLNVNTRAGFAAMNQALKARVEQ